MATTTDFIKILGDARSALAALSNINTASKALTNTLKGIIDQEAKQNASNVKAIASVNRMKKAVGGLNGELRRQTELLKTRNAETNRIVSPARGKFTGFGNVFGDASANTTQHFTPLLTQLKKAAAASGVTKERYDELFAAISNGSSVAATDMEAGLVTVIRRIVGLVKQQEKAHEKAALAAQKAYEKAALLARNAKGELLKQLAAAKELARVQAETKSRSETIQGQRQVGTDLLARQFGTTAIPANAIQRDVNKITFALNSLLDPMRAGKASLADYQTAYQAFSTRTVQQLSPIQRTLLNLMQRHQDATEAIARTAAKQEAAQQKLEQAQRKIALAAQKATGELIKQLAVSRELANVQARAESFANQRGAGADILAQQFTPSIPANAAFPDINRVTISLNKLIEPMLKGKATLLDYQKAYTAFSTGTIQRLSAIQRALLGLMQTHDNATKKLKSNSDRIIKNNDDQKRSVDTLINRWSFFARLLLVQQIHLVVGRLTSAIFESVRASAEFQKKISEIRTISQNAQLSFSQWADTINRVSRAFGADNTDTAAAAYQIISDQIAQGAEAVQFLNAALRLSLIGVTDVATTAKALSSLVNAFQLSTQEAEHLTDVLFRLIDISRSTASELAEIGNLSATAAPLGITFEEMGASIAVISRQGVNTHTTMTNLGNLFNRMSKPSKVLQETLDKMGFSTVRQGIAALRLTGFMKELFNQFERTGEGQEALAELFPDLRGRRAAEQTVRNAELRRQHAEAVGQLKDPSNLAATASTIIFENQAKQLEKQVKSLGIALQESFGQPFIRFLNQSGKLFGEMKDGIIPLLNIVKELAIGWGVVKLATLAWGQVTAVQASIAANRILGVRTSITLLRGAFSALQGVVSFGLTLGLGFVIDKIISAGVEAQAARDRLSEFSLALRKLNADARDAEGVGFTKVQEGLKDQIGAVEGEYARVLAAIRLVLNGLGDAAESSAKKAEKAFKAAGKSIESAMDKALKLTEDSLKDSEKAIEKLIDLTRQLTIDNESGIFERSFSQIDDPAKQLDALLKRTNELRTKAQALQNGQDANPEEVLRLYEEINRLLERRFQINLNLSQDEKKSHEAREKARQRLIELETTFNALAEERLKFQREEQARQEAIQKAKEKHLEFQKSIFAQLDEHLQDISEAAATDGGLAEVAEALDKIKKLDLGGAGINPIDKFNLVQSLEAKQLRLQEAVAIEKSNAALKLAEKAVSDLTIDLTNFVKVAGDLRAAFTARRDEASVIFGNTLKDFETIIEDLVGSTGLTFSEPVKAGQLTGNAKQSLDALLENIAEFKTTKDPEGVSQKIIKQFETLQTTIAAIVKNFPVLREGVTYSPGVLAEAERNKKQAEATQGLLQDFLDEIKKFQQAAQDRNDAVAKQKEAQDLLNTSKINEEGIKAVINELSRQHKAGQTTTQELINSLKKLQETITERLPPPKVSDRGSPLLPNAANATASVTTNVGEINITVSGPEASPENVIALGRALRREIQRGTVNLTPTSTT